MNILKLAIRYFTHFKSFNRLTFIMSIIGVAIGVSAILISSSIMRGFENLLIDKTIMLEGHMRGPALCAHPNIKEANQFWDGKGIISYKNKGSGVILKSWSSNKFLNKENNANEKMAAIGKKLSKNMSVTIGDKISILIPMIVNGELITNSYKCQISDIITTGVEDYDETLVVLPWQLIKNNAFKVNYEFFLHDINKLSSTAKDIPDSTTWIERHESLFSMIKIERRIINTILTLILAMSGVCIFANIQLILHTRTRNIFILKVLGMKDKYIKRIFVLIGLIIGLIGTCIGIIISFIIVMNPFLVEFIFDTLFHGSVNLSIPIYEIFSVILFHIILCIMISYMPIQLDKTILFSRVMRG